LDVHDVLYEARWEVTRGLVEHEREGGERGGEGGSRGWSGHDGDLVQKREGEKWCYCKMTNE
jgi:hypothetical protein